MKIDANKKQLNCKEQTNIILSRKYKELKTGVNTENISKEKEKEVKNTELWPNKTPEIQ